MYCALKSVVSSFLSIFDNNGFTKAIESSDKPKKTKINEYVEPQNIEIKGLIEDHDGTK